METLLDSPISLEFDLHTLPFTPSDPLLNSLGVNHLSIIRILYDNCPEFANAIRKGKVQNIKAVDVCEARGFLSHIIRTTFQFVDPKQPTHSFVIKIPQSETYEEIVNFGSSSSSTTSSLGGNETNSIFSTHNNECDFYELFQTSQSFNNTLALPRVYYTRRNSDNHKGGMILMEDLSNRGTCVDVFSSLTAQQCKNVAKEIAHLQACFDFMTPEQKNLIAKEECVHTAADKQQFLEEFLHKIGKYGQEFTDLLGKLQPFANIHFAKHALIDKAKEIGCTTLVHGDAWTNNVMFCRGQDGEISDELCALIDWQTAFQGNPLFDLSFLLASSTNAEVRRDITTEVVDFYFDTLYGIYQEQGRPLNLTRDQAHQLFKLCQLHQAPVLGALTCFFGYKMEMSCPDKDFVDSKMTIISERTKQLMIDVLEYAQNLNDLDPH